MQTKNLFVSECANEIYQLRLFKFNLFIVGRLV